MLQTVSLELALFLFSFLHHYYIERKGVHDSTNNNNNNNGHFYGA